jgi:pimeloyl-ACP methyl ester carboxylesterase
VWAPADAVERELVAASTSTAHFVGSSLGGALALELATRGRDLTGPGSCAVAAGFTPTTLGPWPPRLTDGR